MTTAPPEQINGHPRPEQRDAVTKPPAMYDPVAEAEADAIRARTYAEAEALREAARIKAEAEAEAVRVKAAAEAEKQRIANEKAAMRLEKEKADHDAYLARKAKEREDAEREARNAREKDTADRAEEEKNAKHQQNAEDSWKYFAVVFAIACAIVALPVQMAAFWHPNSPWMLAAPLMLEGGAWVVLRGAAAAVAARRPHWHYRLIAWLLAFVAAGINLWHGMIAFDPATAIGTGFASLAGPGVWDLYEHGQIRKRDGALTWRQRRAEKKAQEAAAAEKAAREAEQRAAKKAAEEAATAAAQELAKHREDMFPEVWKHAVKLAAALGDTTVTESIWKRAHVDVEGAPPAESAEIVSMRLKAAKRVEEARSGASLNELSADGSSQAASQMPTVRTRRVYSPPARPGRRTPGDTPKYSLAARKAASITARQAASNTRKEDSK